MNIHGNAVLYGSDITALFHVVGPTANIMQCLFHVELNPFKVWGVHERGGKKVDKQREITLFTTIGDMLFYHLTSNSGFC